MLSSYEAARKDRVAEVTRARKRSNMTHGKEPEKPNSGNEELKHEDGTNISMPSRRQFGGTIAPKDIRMGKLTTHVLDGSWVSCCQYKPGTLVHRCPGKTCLKPS